ASLLTGGTPFRSGENDGEEWTDDPDARTDDVGEPGGPAKQLGWFVSVVERRRHQGLRRSLACAGDDSVRQRADVGRDLPAADGAVGAPREPGDLDCIRRTTGVARHPLSYGAFDPSAPQHDERQQAESSHRSIPPIR